MSSTTISDPRATRSAPGARDLHTTSTPPPRRVAHLASVSTRPSITTHGSGALASVTLACPVTDRAISRLSPRQRQIMDLLAQGLSNAGIASRLHLAEKSVENQLTAIYTEIGVHGGTTDHPIHPRVTAVLTYLLQLQSGRPAHPATLAA